jgi:hypothetical protein
MDSKNPEVEKKEIQSFFNSEVKNTQLHADVNRALQRQNAEFKFPESEEEWKKVDAQQLSILKTTLIGCYEIRNIGDRLKEPRIPGEEKKTLRTYGGYPDNPEANDLAKKLNAIHDIQDSLRNYSKTPTERLNKCKEKVSTWKDTLEKRRDTKWPIFENIRLALNTFYDYVSKKTGIETVTGKKVTKEIQESFDAAGIKPPSRQ